jgi:hypothetical protein
MKNKQAGTIILISTIAIAAWSVTLVIAVIALAAGSCSIQQLGQFGDSFNFVTSLFSALALSGTTYAVIIQHNQRLDDLNMAAENRRHELMVIRISKGESLLEKIARMRRAVSGTFAKTLKGESYDFPAEYINAIDLLEEAEVIVNLHFRSEFQSVIKTLGDQARATLQSFKTLKYADEADSDEYKKAYLNCVESMTAFSNAYKAVSKGITDWNCNLFDLSVL